MSRILLSNVRALLPETEEFEPADILLDGGEISEILPHSSPSFAHRTKRPEGDSMELQADIKKDMNNMLAVPGLIDMHTHLRDPGQGHKESIRSGTEAAVRGGFASVVAMPNTSPVIDSPALIESVREKAEREAAARVHQTGAITQKSRGEKLAELGRMREAGAVAVSDDGRPVMDSEVMKLAMEYSRAFDLPIISHCEDINLSGEGVVHEGYYSTLTGLPGMPASAETVMVARDLCLAGETGCQLHIAHVSTARSLDLIRRARKRGVRVSCEVTPHHFSLTDENITSFDTSCKVNPPLRPREDVEALKEGLADGTVDVITTDHAPHTRAEKDVEFDFAPFGISGLETALGLVFTHLVKPGILSGAEAIKKMTSEPAGLLDIEGGQLRAGRPGDVTVIDEEAEWEVRGEKFRSRGKNTPFQGKTLKGKPVLTAVAGNIMWEDEKINELC